MRTGKCSFLPEEREWLNELLGWGFKDTFRELNPEVSDLFSWFDYRSGGFEDTPKRGLRIDLILASAPLAANAMKPVLTTIYAPWKKPSDHCPIWAALLDTKKS